MTRHNALLMLVLLASSGCFRASTPSAFNPVGGDTRNLAFSDANTGWATHRGLFLTTDGGKSWEATSRLSEVVAFSLVDDGEVWLLGRRSLLRTIDRGESWRDLTRPLVGALPFADSDWFLDGVQFHRDGVGSVMAHGANSSTVLLRTIDGGLSWTALPTPAEEWTLSGLQIVAFAGEFAFLDATRGWLPVGRTLYATSDGGQSWKVLYRSDDEKLLQHVAMLDPQVGWAGRSDGTVLATRDGGLSWRVLDVGDGRLSLRRLSLVSASFGFAVASGKEKVDCAGKGAAPPEILLVTRDGGETWTEVFRSCGAELSVFFLDDSEGWALTKSKLPSPLLPTEPRFRGVAVHHTLNGGRDWTKLFEAN